MSLIFSCSSLRRRTLVYNAAFLLIIISLISSLCLQSALSEIVCEELPKNLCAFAVSSSGKRCILEKTIKDLEESSSSSDDYSKYQCGSSEIEVNEKFAGWVENDQCIDSCGLDREMVGISSDSLMDPHFMVKLCSFSCYSNCPNVVDLYYHLAAGEGVYLPRECELTRANPGRAMSKFSSSGSVMAPGPTESEYGGSDGDIAPSPAAAAAEITENIDHIDDDDDEDHGIKDHDFAGVPESLSHVLG